MLFIIILSGLFNVANLFLTNYGFQRVTAVLASNLLTFESLFAIGIGIVLYKEFPTIKELLGGLLIVFSAYRMNKIMT
jgi:drug/metabolite transporter (DMT)-like permease